MLSDLQKRKLTHLFKINNLSGDGHLAREDMEIAMKNMAHEFNVATSSETFSDLKTMFESQWEQIKGFADPNGDGRVTLPEWLTYWDNILSVDGALDMLVMGYNASFHALFDLVDPSGPKGAFNTDRWGKYFAAYNQPREYGVSAIKAIDKNGSGLVDVNEAMLATREFFGDDPNAPGNALFGPY